MNIKNEYEVRCFFHGELMCPNPREYTKHTRTYEQMKAEYDLLNCDKITDQDIIMILLNTVGLK